MSRFSSADFRISISVCSKVTKTRCFRPIWWRVFKFPCHPKTLGLAKCIPPCLDHGRPWASISKVFRFKVSKTRCFWQAGLRFLDFPSGWQPPAWPGVGHWPGTLPAKVGEFQIRASQKLPKHTVLSAFSQISFGAFSVLFKSATNTLF